MDRVETIRILHVDDEPDFLDFTADVLEREDDRFTVESVTNPGEGLARLADQEFDCIVSDHDMPTMDGVQFLSAVREDYPNLPFILFTGKGGEKVASNAISAGVTDYLQKQGGTSQYTVLANRIENAVAKYHAERRLERSQRRQTELIEASDDLIFMFSRDWDEILYFNQRPQAGAYEEIYGQSRDELEANPRAFIDAIHPDDRERVRDAMQRVSQGSSVDIEYRVNETEGYGRWVWSQAEPVFDDHGQVARVAGFVRDITERKEREQELQRVTQEYEAVFNAVNDGLALIDVVREGDSVEFEIRHLNAAYETVSGLTAADVRGQSPREALGPETWEEIAQHYRQCVETEQPVSYEEVLELPAGKVHWQTELKPVVTDGEVTRIVAVARDITDRT